jgi:hypothetical protein
MDKKIIWALFIAVFIFLPTQLLATVKISPPNLIEVRLNDKFIDKNRVSVSQDIPLDLIGTAKPLSAVYLYIFSEEPQVAQVRVNSEGGWQYRLNTALSLGGHKIEAETHLGKEISQKVELLKFTVLPSKATTLKYIFWSLLVLTVVAAILIVGYIRKIKTLTLSTKSKK